MARRNIYLTDDLDRRVRAAIETGQLDASDVCAGALGRALNGHQAADVELHHQAADPGRLEAIEGKLGQLVTAVGVLLLVVAGGVLFVSIHSLATS